MEANCSFCNKLSDKIVLIDNQLFACLPCFSKEEPFMVEEKTDGRTR